MPAGAGILKYFQRQSRMKFMPVVPEEIEVGAIVVLLGLSAHDVPEPTLPWKVFQRQRPAANREVGQIRLLGVVDT
jgi:hypothetical protein